MADRLGKIATLAILYVLTGKLGLLLAVPPGYATIIWPPSGIALGMLLMHGSRLWPGVFVGSFALNAWISGAYSPEEGLILAKMLTALLIAAGSTAQALVGRKLIERYVGLPLRFDHLRQILRLFLLAGPLACVVAASAGVAALYLSGALTVASLPGNWIAWWAGDVFGILVFLPLVLVAPGSPARLVWRNVAVGGLPAAALLVLSMPLGLTFYAWKIASESAYRQSLAEFQTLAIESEKALLHRLDSYENAMLGGAGFFQGSQQVSRQEWRRYVRAVQIEKKFPGINGIGWIEPVAAAGLPDYLRTVREDDAQDFKIHPAGGTGPYYIIRYIEPELDNRQAIGLNIAFERHRVATAQMSRDSGKTAISRRVVLVQDERKTPGFLLLHPTYWEGMPTGTVAERRAAFRGWIYAPFIAKNFLTDLTAGQGSRLNLRIYDGRSEAPQGLIFSSGGSGGKRAFTVRKQMEVMQQQWLVVWESTPAFEEAEHTDGPLFILVGGLLFTGLFGLFLMIITLRRTETMEWMAGERKFAVPLMIFLALGAGSYALYASLELKEQSHVRKRIDDEADKIQSLLASQIDSELSALKRMAQRWEVAGGTPFRLWQSDAENYLQQLSGLRALEWVDATYHVRWVEPLRGNEKAAGLDIMFDKRRSQALRGAAANDMPTLTAPLPLVQGYTAFIAYLPLKVDGRFDGFIAAIFAVDEFFRKAVRSELKDHYSVEISHAGQRYFSDQASSALQDDSWASERALAIYDKTWSLRIVPTRHFVASQKSSLPLAVLIAGWLIAALTALSVRSILVSRLKSAYLMKSNQLNSAILAGTAHLVIATDAGGTIVTFNKAAEKALGYRADELVGRKTPALLHDAQEVVERARALSDELGETVDPGFAVFISKALREGIESREWTYIRKDGSRFPVNLTVTTLRAADGAVTGYLGVAEDITARKEMDRIKNEFVSVVSHELRTPLTSIRGSLGLILGAFAHDLPVKVKGLIDIAHTNCERLILLINDILDIDKLASGHMRFDVKEELLASITHQAVQANEAYASKFNARIELQAMDQSIKVELDAARYIQVLSNLLSNAAKFSPAGGIITVAMVRDGPRVRVSVTDEGAGIPEEFRARIFGKFSQADSSATRKVGGTGLGLHISKQIVERMKGGIGFETRKDHGTTFWVEFPVVSQRNTALLDDPGGDGKDSALHRQSILHVEDDTDLSNVLSVALQGHVSITPATTLRQARDLLRQQRFALILLDVNMPDGSGLDLLKTVRAAPGDAVPVVILCADAPPPHVHEQVAAVIVKTRVSEARIVETILSVLQRRAAETSG